MSLHIAAKPGQIADKVLLPGDPLRAKFIAENYLEDATCYTYLRGMLGFTGFYKGERVSIQGTGMGMPSFSIYAQELIDSYNVKVMMRIGTCGCYRRDTELGSLIMVSGASTDNGMNRDRFQGISFAPIPDFYLLREAARIAETENFPFQVGGVFTSDKFYDDKLAEKTALMSAYGILATEMETAELYTLAARSDVRALSILSVSDNLITGDKIEPEERDKAFTNMMKVSLETVCSSRIS